MNHVLAPFLTFVAMFIGAGFISGGIVHLGEGFNTWDISLLFLGIVLFVIGSYVQESVYNQKNLKEEGVIPFLFYSLILSIGIGMASGGTQHFLDTPTYSMYLIPAGLFIGLIAFVFKLNIKMTRKEWFLLISGSSIALLVLGLLLAFIASSLPSSLENDAHGHGSVNGESMMPLHQIEINNEADFIEHMIPHHQEAVDSSRYLLSNVDDVAKKDFLQNIIETQSNEIKQMKDWYLAWFGQEYSNDNSYKPMMSDLTSYDKETMIQIYANEMIAHHMAAVEMAEKIQSKTNKSELKTMAENIIVNQNKEIEILKTWLTNEMYMGATEDDMHAH